MQGVLSLFHSNHFHMKATNICPKCQSSGIIRLQANHGPGSSSIIKLKKWGNQYAYFDRYVCSGCGYMEHYVDLSHKDWQEWLEKKLQEKSLDSDFV